MRFSEGLLVDTPASGRKETSTDRNGRPTVENPFGGTPEDLRRLQEMDYHGDLQFYEVGEYSLELWDAGY
jgi:hypothetical protein